MCIKTFINLKKKFDINKHWGKCCCYLEQYGSNNSFYWLDKNTYRIIQNCQYMIEKKKSGIDNNERYILFPQYVSNSRYKEMVKELNNAAVTSFFNKAKDEEDAHFRYRCFIDWNGLEHSEWYKTYLIVLEILIEWCQKNNISYKYKFEKPPQNYIYDGRDLSKVKWYIDEDMFN